MQGPIVTGLRADIVPHREWPLREWLYASPRRYYHRPRSSTRFAPGVGFYERVDPGLRPLCRLLHGNGLCTTPSCQGHFHAREYFEAQWDTLRCEAAEVTTRGLSVRDAETDEAYLFREPTYRLPWPDFRSFHGASAAHQPTGYLGVLIPFGRQRLYERFQSLPRRFGHTEMAFEPETGRRLGAHLFGVLVHPSDPGDGERQWRQVTERIGEVLQERAVQAETADVE